MAMVSSLLLAGCSGGRNDRNRQVVKPSAVAVKVMKAQTSDNVDAMTYVGTVEASRTTVLVSRYSGTLATLNIKEGQQVSAGDKAAEISSQSVESMLEMAQATLAQAQDGYERAKTVHESGSMSEVQWVDVKTQLAKAEASEKAARQAYEDCTVRIPYDGVIGEVYAYEGVDVGVAEPLAKLMDISSLEISFPVPESEIGQITEGMEVAVTVPALGDREFRGKVTVKGISASVLSHCYSCTLVPDGKVTGLLPGMVCKVSVGKSGSGIVIPTSIVKTDMDGRYVWIVSDGKAEKRSISTGGFSGNGVVVESGLENGDLLIVEGTQKVSTGTAVNIVE